MYIHVSGYMCVLYVSSTSASATCTLNVYITARVRSMQLCLKTDNCQVSTVQEAMNRAEVEPRTMRQLMRQYTPECKLSRVINVFTTK